jgi:epoxyqueuosine reductase
MPENRKQQIELTSFVKSRAEKEGFLACGISRVTKLGKEGTLIHKWLKSGFHAEMDYMTNHFEKRSNPRQLVENAKSVISFIYNYYPKEKLSKESHYIISKYAYGRDYHKVIKKKLKPLVKSLREISGSLNTRAFVDSAPVMDKVWAAKSGLGWIGKNTMLINRKFGSFFFVAEIITDIELEYDKEEHKNFCGNCSRCLEACPTGALVSPYVLDARKCISYHTIENKNEKLPEFLITKFENRIFGCDICQDVCPWNKFSKPHQEKDFLPSKELLEMKKPDWEKLDKEKFDELFEDSAVKRAGFKSLKRNIEFVS